MMAMRKKKPARSRLTTKQIEELLRERFCQCKEPLPPTERYNPWGRTNLEKTVCSRCGFRREPTVQHGRRDR